jgi:hypothetical protein
MSEGFENYRRAGFALPRLVVVILGIALGASRTSLCRRAPV